jgi:hypothetical protein
LSQQLKKPVSVAQQKQKTTSSGKVFQSGLCRKESDDYLAKAKNLKMFTPEE